MTFPQELIELPQWVVWALVPKENGKSDKIPICPHTGKLARVNDPATWSSHSHVDRMLASVGGQKIQIGDGREGVIRGSGFVFTASDPFCFIDLDAARNPEDLQLQKQVHDRIVSYTERSISGVGSHILARGSIPSGVRTKSVELYSSGRFAVMTGDVTRDLPLVDCQEQLHSLWEYLSGDRAVPIEHHVADKPETQDDTAIYNAARRASNGDKFNSLWDGNWQSLGFPSQSEADFALIDILAFYTDNREQVKRLFLRSALGQRDKARLRRDYVPDMVNRSFDRKVAPVDLSAIDDIVAEWNKPKEASDLPRNERPMDRTFHELGRFNPVEGTRVRFPPGLLGALAQFVLASAPRPLPQVALATAIATLAGIAGRAFNVSHTGLNQYIMVLGVSGVGKDAINGGMGQIKNAICAALPHAKTFFGPGEIASGTALLKWFASGNPSFVSYTGEVGHLLGALKNPAQSAFKKTLLHAYSASGKHNTLSSMIWADKDKNMPEVLSPAFTWIGETTPETFAEAISETSIKEGLVPRFLFIEAPTIRPPINVNHASATLDARSKNTITELAAHCLTLNSQNRSTEVGFDAEAEKLLGLCGYFSDYCDAMHRGAERDVTRDAWNRTHLKAIKLAALAAVGVNYMAPIITKDLAQWAIEIVMQDIRSVLSRFDNGELIMSANEGQQREVIEAAVKQWITSPWESVKNYAATQGDQFKRLHDARVIPAAFLQRRLAATACFRKDNMGSTYAIKRTIGTMIEMGLLAEMPTNQVQSQFGFSMKVYAVTG